MFKIYSKIFAILLLLSLIGFSLFKLSTIKAQESPTEIPTPNTKISVTPSNDVEEIRKAIGADKLFFLDVKQLKKGLGGVFLHKIHEISPFILVSC